jgi:hypothetical protein
MSADSHAILSRLSVVECERRTRLATPGLEARVAAVKRYQQLRFSHTYADLLKSPRYGPASLFFLDELYGPADFTRRDAQFARMVPALTRLFPDEIVDTVATLSELHALSETLDTRMGQHLDEAQTVSAQSYVLAWQATGRPADRADQIRFTLAVASRLDRLTRKALLRNSLRLMRGPARAAGLADLQRFLELGFDTFRAMKGASEFMSTIDSRERELANALFSATDITGVNPAAPVWSLLPPDPPHADSLDVRGRPPRSTVDP